MFHYYHCVLLVILCNNAETCNETQQFKGFWIWCIFYNRIPRNFLFLPGLFSVTALMDELWICRELRLLHCQSTEYSTVNIRRESHRKPFHITDLLCGEAAIQNSLQYRAVATCGNVFYLLKLSHLNLWCLYGSVNLVINCSYSLTQIIQMQFAVCNHSAAMLLMIEIYIDVIWDIITYPCLNIRWTVFINEAHANQKFAIMPDVMKLVIISYRSFLCDILPWLISISQLGDLV